MDVDGVPSDAKLERCKMRSYVSGRPAFWKRFRKTGWRTALPLYVAWCRGCGAYTVAHPAGYGRIHCRHCRAHWKVMTWARFRDKIMPLLMLAVLLALAWAVVIRYWSATR
jgi:hypothetical protein